MHPPAQQVHPQSQFLGNFLLCYEDLELELVVLQATTKRVVNFFRKKVHRLLNATSKKGRQLCEEKCTPDKILATPML